MLHGMAFDVPWQKLEEAGAIIRLEFLGWVELPEDRPELATQFENAAGEETLDSPASASTRRCVAARGAFTENTKSSGVSPAHLRKLLRDCVR